MTKLPTIRGYKVFNPDFTCKDFKFEVGKTYTHKGEIRICNSGFHFCLKAAHCFSYYSFDSTNIVCEVEALGKIETHEQDSKICTDKIIILRQLTWDEVLKVANDGRENTGHSNSGYRNSGDWNSGYSNSGYSNSGNWNSGDRNSGYRNSGAFCIDNDPILFLFDKPTNIKVREWEQHKCVSIMSNLDVTLWIPESLMSDEEKKANPKYETTEGYLKTISIKEAWANLWGNMTKENKNLFLTLPNFDASIFESITGTKTTSL